MRISQLLAVIPFQRRKNLHISGPLLQVCVVSFPLALFTSHGTIFVDEQFQPSLLRNARVLLLELLDGDHRRIAFVSPDILNSVFFEGVTGVGFVSIVDQNVDLLNLPIVHADSGPNIPLDLESALGLQ